MAISGTPGAHTRVPQAQRQHQEVEAPRRLRVVSPRRINAARRRRQARALILVSITVIVGSIFVIGMGQNLLGTQQIRLDSLRQQLSAATLTNENLLLSRAQLEAPARILQLAEHRLGMVTPQSVVYLTPVKTGPSVANKAKESLGASR